MHKLERLWTHGDEVFRPSAPETGPTKSKEIWVQGMLIRSVACVLCVVAAGTIVFPQQNEPGSALPMGRERFQAEIHEVESSLPQISDRGAAIFFLASLYAGLGDSQKALALLEQCPIQEGFDPGGVRAFRSLESNSEFRGWVARIHQRYHPVHNAHVAFAVAESDLFPEGLAVDSTDHLFYLGSEYHNKIVKITETGRASDFVRQGLYDLMPVGGVHVDPADHSVWAATDPGPKNRSEIVHFDTTGKLLERYTAPGTGPRDLNDLAIRDSREIYATDTFANQVYRFDRSTRHFSRLSFPRPIFYPNGVTLSGDGDSIYVADMLGVLRVDLQTGTAREVKVDGHFTLAGIDGLYWYRGGLVGIQYGAGAYRVMRWQLGEDGLRVVSAKMLEYRTALVKNPTTGAIVGDDFYFMANTGIQNLDGGRIADKARLEPVWVAILHLR
jgi:sugar lactone lactonase YvrE